MQKHRCQWCGEDPLYVRYHDEEWGLPTYDDATLFEFLILEGAQAGLAWITVLKKREGYRAVFDQFDPNKIARFSDAKLAALKLDERIIRNDEGRRAFVYGHTKGNSSRQGRVFHGVDGVRICLWRRFRELVCMGHACSIIIEYNITNLQRVG